MPHACQHQISDAQEKINRNIILLGAKMESLRNRNVETNSVFHQWQKKWSEEKSLIEKHFENIEEKISQLKSSRKITHKLSIYDVPPDSDGMTTIGPF